MQTLIVLFFWDFKRLVICNSLKNSLLFSNFLMVFYFKPIHCSNPCKVTSTCWEILTGPLVELFCHHRSKSIYSLSSEDSVHTWQVCQTGLFFFPLRKLQGAMIFIFEKMLWNISIQRSQTRALKSNIGSISYLGKEVHWFQLWNFVQRDVMGNWK